MEYTFYKHDLIIKASKNIIIDLKFLFFRSINHLKIRNIMLFLILISFSINISYFNKCMFCFYNIIFYDK